MRWLAALLVLLVLAACRSQPLSVGGLRIEGNQSVPDADLIEAARRSLDAFARNDRRLADADDAAFAMESALRSSGHPEAKVRFELTGESLVFRVSEGPRAIFGKPRFEGVTSVPLNELEALFEFPGTGFLERGAPLYEPARVRSAISDVEGYYLARGYLDVEAAQGKLQWNEARTVADVVVRVTEGRRFLVSALTVVGGDPAPVRPEDVEGRAFEPSMPFELAAKIRRRLRNEGYAFAKVEGRADVDRETARVAIRIDVDPGEPVRLRDVRIEGNRQTATAFIRQRFGLVKGQVVERSLYERGIADLYRSRLFARVSTTLDPVGRGEADLGIRVEEADTKRLDLEVGWGSWELLRGQVEYKDFNLFGWGRILRATALASLKSYGGEVELEDPWILGQDNRVWVNVHALFRDERFYDYAGLGTELAFERRFSRHVRAWGGYRFDLEEASHLSGDIPQDVRDETDGFQRSAGLFLRGRYEDRDDRFLPTQGWYAEASAFWSTVPLGASLSYLELEGRATYHFDLGSGGVLAVGGWLGVRKPFSGTVLPLPQRYFLGGQESVRSFGQDQLTPTAFGGAAIGAETALEGHVEWRRQLFDVFYGALFYDAGFVALDAFSLDGDVGHGLGAGLRVYTPVGPIRLDAAWNPGPMFAATDRWQLHFSFGFSF